MVNKLWIASVLYISLASLALVDGSLTIQNLAAISFMHLCLNLEKENHMVYAERISLILINSLSIKIITFYNIRVSTTSYS